MKYTPKTRRGQETLDRIMNAAIVLMAKKGFNNTSIDDIVREAEVSHGLFYFYFRNKDELLVKLVEKINREMRHYLTVSTEGYRNRVDVEKAGFRAFFRWMHDNQYLYKVLIEAESNNIEIYKWHYMKIAERYSARLREAMERGEVSKYDPEALAFALMGIADFIAKRYILWPNEKAPESVVNDVERMLEKLLSP